MIHSIDLLPKEPHLSARTKARFPLFSVPRRITREKPSARRSDWTPERMSSTAQESDGQ